MSTSNLPRDSKDLSFWLGRREEDSLIIDPELPIIDPHHHFFDRSNGPLPREQQAGHGWPHYLLPELLNDTGSGHNIVATVFISCSEMYRATGPEPLRPVGETEFVTGVAAMAASGYYGHENTRVCAGIVGFADFTLGAKVEHVLEAQMAAGGGRLRGVRIPHTREVDLHTWNINPDKSGLMTDKNFRTSFALLGKFALSYDALIQFMQIPQLVDLARAFPDISIIANHCGGIVGTLAYENRHAEYFQHWKSLIKELATCPNVFMKLGGVGKASSGLKYLLSDEPPTTDELLQAWGPYIYTCIDAFGPDRCMFESNFPVDNQSCSYRTLWNVFKRLAAAASPTEKALLFSGTARQAYKLP